MASAVLCSGQSLLENSPFLPPDFQAPGNAPSVAPGAIADNPSDLKLQGIFEIAGKYRFNIFDRQSGRSQWVGLEDGDSGYNIVSYDRANRSIGLRLGDRVVDLKLEKPSDNPRQVMTARTLEQAGPPPPPETRRRVVVPPRRVVRPRDADSDRVRRRVPPPPPRNSR